jgi:hypothetical protein
MVVAQPDLLEGSTVPLAIKLKSAKHNEFDSPRQSDAARKFRKAWI